MIKCRSADCNATSYLEVVGNLVYRVVIAAHAVCVRTAMPSQYTGEFPTFPNTREHIASYFPYVLDMSFLNPSTKLLILYDNPL